MLLHDLFSMILFTLLLLLSLSSSSSSPFPPSSSPRLSLLFLFAFDNRRAVFNCVCLCMFFCSSCCSCCRGGVRVELCPSLRACVLCCRTSVGTVGRSWFYIQYWLCACVANICVLGGSSGLHLWNVMCVGFVGGFGHLSSRSFRYAGVAFPWRRYVAIVCVRGGSPLLPTCGMFVHLVVYCLVWW